MEDQKRTIFAVVIACVVLVAVLYSFGLSLFTQDPDLVLADPDATASQGQSGDDPGDVGGIPVEVTPRTVQRMIADLARYESYSRIVAVAYNWGAGETGALSAQVWADGGWTRTDVTLPSGVIEHSIVGEGQLWLWYDEGEQVYSGEAGAMTADLMQRIPTYEDVLALEVESITDAGYVERGGQACVYVESRQPELGYLYRYWISVSSGLLVAAETEKDGAVVYSMSSYEVVSPLGENRQLFTLPDGTELGAVSTEGE